jgi:hypothetical protein
MSRGILRHQDELASLRSTCRSNFFFEKTNNFIFWDGRIGFPSLFVNIVDLNGFF